MHSRQARFSNEGLPIQLWQGFQMKDYPYSFGKVFKWRITHTALAQTLSSLCVNLLFSPERQRPRLPDCNKSKCRVVLFTCFQLCNVWQCEQSLMGNSDRNLQEKSSGFAVCFLTQKETLKATQNLTKQIFPTWPSSSVDPLFWVIEN